MKLILLCGPPAVGKMTVGQQLSKLTGLPLFHNHMTIDPIRGIFERGTPAFDTLVGEFRYRVIEEGVKAGIPGIIHTLVWAFGNTTDEAYIKTLKDLVEDAGGQMIFVELTATVDERKRRHNTENRTRHKPDNASLPAGYIAELEGKFKMNTSGDFPYPENHLKLNSEDLTPVEAAEIIVKTFHLSRD